MQQVDNKKLILNAVSEVFKTLKKGKSNYLFGAEFDISTSLLSHLDRGIKDPQLTTIFKLSQALGVSTSEFISMVEEKLPADFSMLEE